MFKARIPLFTTRCFRLGKFYIFAIITMSSVLLGCNDGSNSNTRNTDTNNSKGSVTPPSNEQQNHLIAQFTRKPPAQSIPNVKQIYQEIPGRPFELKIFRVLSHTHVEDVTQQVTWHSETADCLENTCYEVKGGDIIAKEELRTFQLVAEYDGLKTPTVTFESLAFLKPCENDTSNRDNCLHIVQDSSGSATDKQFTEPPRVGVMETLGYKADSSYFNTGYTFKSYSVFKSITGSSNAFPLMLNSGFDSNSKAVTAGSQGQYARYCRDLAEIKFNGRSNWRRATLQEMLDLSNQDVVGVYGWPDTLYATSTIEDKYSRKLNTIVLRDGLTLSAYENEAQLATCVSPSI